MLDLRFVFVLRCLYRQGESSYKTPEIRKKPEIWKKNKKQKKIKIKLVNTSVNTKKLFFSYKNNGRNKGETTRPDRKSVV